MMPFTYIEFVPYDKDLNKLGEEPIKALFNPNTYTITKTVNWNPATARASTQAGQAEAHAEFDAPAIIFGGGESRQLTMELFYDVTEPPENQPRVKDVRELTNRVAALTRIHPKLQYPPVVVVSWGNPLKGSDFPFTGVVTQLTQNFTHFNRDCLPVRAILNLTMREYLSPEQNKRETDPEATTRLVKRGDTLAGIAAEVYRNPELWRLIAEANKIDDPRRLPIGQRLSIP
jgi:nucleoid-associated protein YgaU